MVKMIDQHQPQPTTQAKVKKNSTRYGIACALDENTTQNATQLNVVRTRTKKKLNYNLANVNITKQKIVGVHTN